MKRIFLALFFFFSFVSAEINEYMSYVYFANGIDTSFGSATKSKNELIKKFKLSNPQSYKLVPPSHVV